MKTSLFASSLFFLSTNAFFAQSLQEAIKKTDNERFEAASADFKALIAKEPGKGDYYFYFGENYFKKGDLDSAQFLYAKGVEVNATYPLNYVGLGKSNLFKGNETDANTNFFKAKSIVDDKANKALKPLVLMKIAEAYTSAPVNKNLSEAIKLLNEAIKLDGKNPETYILMGDALLEQNPTDGTQPIKQYDKAFELDKKSVKAVLRKGKLYQRSRNYNLALDFYKQAESIDANFAPAYREKGELYHMAGQDGKAVENYKKYLELNNSDEARKRYIYFLFGNKQYNEVIAETPAMIQQFPNNPYLYRVLGYSYFEMGDKTDKDAYKKGLEAIKKFFELSGGDNKVKYLDLDYKYLGLLLAKTGNDSLGVQEIEKAIKLDPKVNCDLNGDIARIYVKAKKYDKALPYFEKKAQCEKGLSGQECFDMGRAYFFGLKDFVKADTAFSNLIRISPTYPLGYFYRGKCNVQFDPNTDKGLAKPFFEKALELLKPEEKSSASYKNDVIIAYEYLGYYFLKNKDNAKAKEYFKLLQELDPNNKKAKDFLASPAGK